MLKLLALLLLLLNGISPFWFDDHVTVPPDVQNQLALYSLNHQLMLFMFWVNKNSPDHIWRLLHETATNATTGAVIEQFKNRRWYVEQAVMKNSTTIWGKAHFGPMEGDSGFGKEIIMHRYANSSSNWAIFELIPIVYEK